MCSFQGPNILMTGDVFTVGSYPILDYATGGWIGGLSDATKTLVGLTDAQYVTFLLADAFRSVTRACCFQTPGRC